MKRLIIFGLFLACWPLMAQDKGFKRVSTLTTAEGQNKWALVVGINRYLDDGITNLRFAVNDAEKLYQLLVDPEYGGFDAQQVKILTDRTEVKPIRRDVLVALNSLQKSADIDDTIFIFFSGHGIAEDGQTYFLTRDTDRSLIADTAVAKSAFERTMNRTQAKVQVMFFDACHSGATKDKSGAEGMAADLAAFIDQQSDGRVVLSSCGLNEVAYEDDQSGHGVFTRYLLEGLKGNADQDADGMVSASEVSAYASQKVKAWAFNNNKTQNPRMSANVSGEILLTVNREGERLAQLSTERSQLEQQLEKTKQKLKQAQKANDALSQVEARQREAELQEKVRRAQAAEALERQREETAREEREQAARQQQQQSIKQAATREKARRAQAEIERKKQQLEAERQRLQAQQLETMDIGQILDKAKELQAKIDQVGPQVRGEVKRQIAAVPQPIQRKVSTKGEFETTAMYQQRLQQAKQADKLAEQKYQQEVSQIRQMVEGEIKARSQGYQQALSILNRDLVLDESQVELDLGSYNADEQFFAEAKLSVRNSREVESFSWLLKVPLAQAKQFKQSATNGMVKIRAEIRLDVARQTARIDSAEVEDLVQGLRYESEAPEQELMGQDRTEMVLIPAGSFQMGSNDGGSDEKPVHRVELDGFYMDKYEVSNGQYRTFIQATGHPEPKHWNDSRFNQPYQPVVGVSWHDATAYAKWVGKRLPTEAEWEYAARGGLVGKKYVWGNKEPTASKANYGRKIGKTSVVGSYETNGYGLYDIAGNVLEWCADWYAPGYYGKSAKNPSGPGTGSYRVLRGGNWYYSTFYLRVADRDYHSPYSRTNRYGFRCVSDLP